MARKGFDFFGKLAQQMSICNKAAQQLVDLLENFNDVSVQAAQIHVTEHEGDMLLHEIMNELNRSFITPIEREDIADLANKLDDITDLIEDVAKLFDMLIITELRNEAKTLGHLIHTGCQVLHEAVSEFSHFKNSKKLKDLIIKVNVAEEDGDRVYRAVIKNMYQTEKDPLTIMKWKEIFDTMENVLDDCEDAANLLDSLTIKNN